MTFVTNLDELSDVRESLCSASLAGCNAVIFELTWRSVGSWRWAHCFDAAGPGMAADPEDDLDRAPRDLEACPRRLAHNETRDRPTWGAPHTGSNGAL